MKRIVLFSALVFLFNSCSETKTGGCIDVYADNYESYADFDDGSCIYTADAVFFYDAITANELLEPIKKECLKWSIPFYNVSTQGAYLAELM